MKKQFKIAGLIAAILALSIFASCELFSPYAKLYGTWGTPSVGQWEFKTDDTWSLTGLNSGNTTKYQGTYTATTDHFTIKGTKVFYNGTDISTSSPGSIDDADGTYGWSVSGTTLTLNASSGTATYTRQ